MAYLTHPTPKLSKGQKKKRSKARKHAATQQSPSTTSSTAMPLVVRNEAAQTSITSDISKSTDQCFVSTAKTTTFLNLPGRIYDAHTYHAITKLTHLEIRNRIYEIFSHDSSIQRPIVWDHHGWLHALTLSKTCRQIRSEFTTYHLQMMEEHRYKNDPYMRTHRLPKIYELGPFLEVYDAKHSVVIGELARLGTHSRSSSTPRRPSTSTKP